jgi:Fe-S cluster assembly ATP-binding protein
MKREFLKRGINKGFSGGEKKKNEILQMSLFSPKLSILDEIDSGLDVDSLKVIAKIIEGLRTYKNSIVLITHYKGLLRYITPNFVHILKGGKIVKTGGKELVNKLEKEGYTSVK